MALKLRLLKALQHQVLLQREVQNQAVLVPILRNMAHAGLAAVLDRGMGDIMSAKGDPAAGGLLQPGQGVDQIRLAVAVNACNTHDLPRTGGKGNILHRIVLGQAGGNAQMFHCQHGLSGPGRVLLHHQLHGAAHHHAAQFLLRGGGGVHRAYVAALAQHRHAVGYLHDLIELVRDEQNALAFPGQPPHDLHQLFDFLWSEHGGGLVKDKHLIIAVEHFENLHTLLHAHGDILDFGVQVHFQAVALAQGKHLFPRRLAAQEAQAGVLRSQDDVIQHGKDVDQLKMLMDHTDMQGGGVVGIVDLDLFAVLFDDAFVRLIEAEEHAHQRGFAGAVFAQQGVNLAPAQLQRNVVVGLDPRKFLGDVEHFDNVFRRVIQPRPPPFLLVSTEPCLIDIVTLYRFDA